MISALFLGKQGLSVYQEQLAQQKEYERIALEIQQEEKALRELEKQADFYEKLKHGFDAKILVLGNSMALSEGASSQNLWLDILQKTLEEQFESNIYYKSMGMAYSGYGVGYTQLATLDDHKDYDAVIICYPAAQNEEELIQLEAILCKIREQYDNCAIISVIANGQQEIDISDTVKIIEHYGGSYVNMQQIIHENGDSVLDHEFYPNDKGYGLYANAVFESVKQSVAHDGNDKENVEPINEQVKQYAYCVFVPLRDFRKLDDSTLVLDLESFTGKMCIQARWTAGNKAYDFYHDYGKWITRNEFSYVENCWYDTFLFHDIPKADNEIMIVLGREANISEIQGVYLISENPIVVGK